MLAKIKKLAASTCASQSQTDSPRRASYPGEYQRPGEPSWGSEGEDKVGASMDRRSAGGQSMLTDVMENGHTFTSALEALQEGIQRGEGGPRDLQKSKLLGKGGFGEVWLATTDRGQTKIALKELKKPILFRPNSEESRNVIKQLPFAEAAIQSLLVHENIVRTLWADVSIVHPVTGAPLNVAFRSLMGASSFEERNGPDAKPDAGDDGDDYAQQFDINHLVNHTSELGLPEEVGLCFRIAMEFCELGSLLDYLAPASAVPMNVKIGGNMEMTLCAEMTALDIAKGLRLLHITRVIHGDLKPHNILFARDMKDPRTFIAKVADFGLSGHLHKGEHEIGGITCGSVQYMAPESLRQRALSAKSDVYGFGLLMWELWHNDCWAGHFDREFRRRKKLNPRAGYSDMEHFVPQCHDTCPREYTALVDECLRFDPATRPTMKAIKQRLEDSTYQRLEARRR